MLDLLEDAIAANNRETRNFLKLLDEAQEISEDLSALPELFSKARDRSQCSGENKLSSEN